MGGTRRAGSRVTKALIGLVLLLPGTATAGGSQEPSVLDSGPLPLRDRFTLDLGFMVLTPSQADVLDSGRWWLGATASLFTSWSSSEEIRFMLEQRPARADVTLDQLRSIEPFFEGTGYYHADGQVQTFELSARRGIGLGMELFARGVVIRPSGGFMDGFIESLHSSLGFSDASRDFATRNAYSQYLRTSDGRELYRDSGSGTQLGDFALGARKELPGPRERWTHSIEAAVELPTGSNSALVGSGSIDVGLAYQAELRRRRTRFRGSLAVVRHGANDPVLLKSKVLTTLWLGFERALGARTSFLVQASYGQSRYREISIMGLADRVFLFDLGFKRRVERLGTLFMAITQDSPRGAMSDVGLHLGWQREF